MGSCGAEPPAGGRRRRTKKHHRRRRHRTLRGGTALPGYVGPVMGASGQPAGAGYEAFGLSRAGPAYRASSYDQQGEAGDYKALGGRRRSRRHRSRRHRRSRHRMRGGDASDMGGLGKGGGASASFTTGEPITTDSGSSLTLRGFALGSTRA